MPRSGINGTYTLPGPQATQAPLTPIPSAVNNAGWSDVEQTFNTVQPEAYGGTGASTFAQARSNLGLVIGVNVSPVPKGHIFGLTLSNNATDATNDIDIAIGEAASDVTTLLVLSSVLTKRLDAAWAVGSGNGGLDTGSIANTTYHVFLIQRSDTGVVDALFSTSATSPTMPSNYDRKRRIGSIVRIAGAIKPFIQDGDYFTWTTVTQDVVATNPGTAAVTRTLTVPVGVRVRALLSVFGSGASGTADGPGGILITDLATADATPTGATSTISIFVGSAVSVQVAAPAEVYTNTSAQVRSRMQISSAGSSLIINTRGYVDTRGR